MEEFKKRIIDADIKEILGQEKTKMQIKSALIAGRHLTIFGPPGIGKTTIAKNFASILPEIEANDCGYNCLPDNPVCPVCRNNPDQKRKRIKGIKRFVRVQGSPDLTVEDLLGDIDPIIALKEGPTSPQAFTPGKIFKANNGILFFDEINRCPEKLQNALLQVLEEKKATIGNYDVDIDSNFILIATMNPVDINTERLSDVLLDRFDVVYMTYPETDMIEMQVVRSKGKNIVDVPDDIVETMTGFVRNLRENEMLEIVPSVRATLGLYERSQATALLKGKSRADMDDLEDVMESVISHRIRLKPSSRYITSTSKLVREEFRKFREKCMPGDKENTGKGGGP